MLTTTNLSRVFLHKDNGTEIRLTDPGEHFSPEAVMVFYSATYPVLTNAKLSGPEIRNDQIEYRFEGTLGVKG
jgi:PRTRC genetic system protein C